MKTNWKVSVTTFLVTFGWVSVAFADTAAKSGGNGWAAIGAGLCIAIAALGGALGQGKIGVAVLEGIARNPSANDKMFTPMILALAFVESLVIFSLLIAFLLYGKV